MTERYIDIPFSAEAIIAQLGVESTREGASHRIACVVHGGDGLNLSLMDAGGKLDKVKCWSRGCDAKDIRAELAGRLGIMDAGAFFGESPAPERQGVQCSACRSRWYWDTVHIYYTPAGEERCAMRYDCRGPECKFRTRQGSNMVHPDGERKHLRGGSARDTLPMLVNDKQGNVIVLVEGEKAAEAHSLDGYTFATWKGGANTVGYVDFAPFDERDVILWPDDDAEGRDAMEAIRARGRRWRSVKMIETTGETTEDAANYTADQALQLIAGATEPMGMPEAFNAGAVAVDPKSVIAECDLPSYLITDRSISIRLNAEVERIRRFRPKYILKLRSREAKSLMIRRIDGLWDTVSDRLSGDLSAVLHLMQESRQQAREELVTKVQGHPGGADYIDRWDKSLVATPKYIRDTIALLIAEIHNSPDFEVVGQGEMGSYHEVGMVPLKDWAAFDLSTGMVLDSTTDEVGEKRLLDYGWAIATPDMPLLTQPVGNGGFMKEVIEGHWGLGIIWDVAAAIVGTSKKMIFYRNPTSDSGKDTLAEAVKLALNGASTTMPYERAFSEQGRRFTNLEEVLVQNYTVWINEIGLAGEIRPGIVNLLDARSMSVEIKKQQVKHNLPRLGTLILIGAAYPAINMSHQGVPNRIGHCHDIYSERRLTEHEADRLLSPEAIAYLRALLLDTASDMKRNGLEWYHAQGQWIAAEDSADAYVQQYQDERVQALKDVFEEGEARDMVWNADITKVIKATGEDVPKGPGLTALVSMAFPRAIPHRTSSGRGYRNVRAIATTPGFGPPPAEEATASSEPEQAKLG